MDLQQQLFSAMTVVQDQQESMEKLLAALQAEREQLAARNAALVSTLEQLQTASGRMESTAAAAVRESMNRSMLGVADKAAEAATQGVQPLFEQVKTASEQASFAGDKLHDAANAIGGRLLTWALFSVVVLTVCGAATGYITTALTQSEVEELRQERAHLQATVTQLERRGGRLEVVPCDKTGKYQCVEIERKVEPFLDINERRWAAIKK